jgi:tetratricopeptide (TPR) repeat protein
LTDATERNFELKSFGQDSRPASERPRSREDRGRVAHAAITLLKEGFTLVEPERGEALMERAIEVFDDVIARRHEASNPLDREQVAKAAGYKAYILHRLDRHEQALRAYDEQVFLFGAESSPVMKRHVGRALVNKGILLAEMPGRQYDALAAYNQAISSLADAFEPALRELVAEALFNKAIVLDRRLEFRADQLAVYDELISRFGEVSEPEVRPYVASALVAKGQILALMDRAEEGRAIYEQVISQFADAPEPAVRDEVTRAIALLGKAE